MKILSKIAAIILIAFGSIVIIGGIAMIAESSEEISMNITMIVIFGIAPVLWGVLILRKRKDKAKITEQEKWNIPPKQNVSSENTDNQKVQQYIKPIVEQTAKMHEPVSAVIDHELSETADATTTTGSKHTVFFRNPPSNSIRDFSIKARYVKTKRIRTEFISLRDKENIEDVIIEKMKENGFIEPFEIIETFTSPSDAQLDYCKILKINVPKNASMYEVSDMIDNKKSGGGTPHPELIEYADEIGLLFSDYIGKKQLYNMIFANLQKEDKIAFFIFCVYRWISDDRKSNLNKHLYREKFYEFAKEQALSDKFVKSLGQYSGEDIRFFGKITYSDGNISYGGSTNTLAYKTCVKFLENRLGLKNKTSAYLKSEQMRVQKGQSNSGCMSVLILLILITSIVSVFLI